MHEQEVDHTFKILLVGDSGELGRNRLGLEFGRGSSSATLA
jgi:hypothetical protein